MELPGRRSQISNAEAILRWEWNDRVVHGLHEIHEVAGRRQSAKQVLKPMSDLIEVNPKKLGGKPVFRGTRIPISYLAQYLNEGRTVEDFIDAFDIDPNLVRQVYEEKFEDDPMSDSKRPA